MRGWGREGQIFGTNNKLISYPDPTCWFGRGKSGYETNNKYAVIKGQNFLLALLTTSLINKI